MEALVYKRDLGNQKPSDFGKVKDECPFCHYQDVENIIETSKDIIWTQNKYPVLAKTNQTLIIETHDHKANFGTYSPEHAQEVLRFSFAAWEKLKASKKYKSVIFYKNHGPLSGGTLSHAHMQIIGLNEVEAYEFIQPKHFEGIEVCKNNLIKVNFSTQPFCGLRETNVIIEQADFPEALPNLSKVIQKTFGYHLEKHIFSFNIFFYDFEGKYIVKFVPRFPTPPYYVGFGIPQVLDEETLKQDAKELAERIELNN
ncbi:MAG: DUF4931 domain-containing protein [Streptococcaceae bacterium]|jgi:diadenosine tetraphosphate (Ap4A) HIT family hydrolase|nr:DUF4931 domain-containing protein [Streptococcaceae bacterium]